jgi:hypothetical protein
MAIVLLKQMHKNVLNNVVKVTNGLWVLLAIPYVAISPEGRNVNNFPWLLDYIWVRDLMAPMHLGLINRPSVPHVKITGAL